MPEAPIRALRRPGPPIRGAVAPSRNTPCGAGGTGIEAAALAELQAVIELVFTLNDVALAADVRATGSRIRDPDVRDDGCRG